MSENPSYSVIIPVYNSADVVDQTLAEVSTFFEAAGLSYEIIAVNDGSGDRSWQVLENSAARNPHILAIDLLRNYGQHTAVFCGMQESRGRFVITLDDDLQNPPEEIRHLITKSEEGHDAVFGRFRKKKHPWHRRLGTILIGILNSRIFGKPSDLVLSNFRLVRRDVVDRICRYQTHYPYIPGLVLMYATKPVNVWVEHRSRTSGTSGYTTFKIFELVARILLSYSVYPLRIVSLAGISTATLSFFLGLYYLLQSLFVGTRVPGWATVVVLLSFFNGITMLSLSILGEYTVRLLNQTSSSSPYYIRERAGVRQEQ